jgi:hypothetical protein
MSVHHWLKQAEMQGLEILWHRLNQLHSDIITLTDFNLSKSSCETGTFSGQFTAREQATGSEKKPLNAYLGEQFIGDWNGGETHLVSEQVHSFSWSISSIQPLTKRNRSRIILQ